MSETDWDKVWVKVEHATKQFFTKKGTVTALEDVNLEVHDGEFVCLLGPSGCGKTTTLRLNNARFTDENPSFILEKDGAFINDLR